MVGLKFGCESFTRSKSGPHAVRRTGRNLSGTTHPTLLPIGGRSSYSRSKSFVSQKYASQTRANSSLLSDEASSVIILKPHISLPKARVEAPMAGSIILAGIPMKTMGSKRTR